MIKAVVLAAGRGSRLAPLTKNKPKGMVEVNGRAMIDWQYKALTEAGINDITFITGYLGNVIDMFLNIINLFSNLLNLE